MTKTPLTTTLLICLIASAAMLLLRAVTLAPNHPVTAKSTTIEAARDYVSAIQTYLVNGDLDALNGGWTDEIELAALRHSYPATDISLVSARPQDDSFVVHFSTGEPRLPAWLMTGAEPMNSAQIVQKPNPFESESWPQGSWPISWLPVTPKDFSVHVNSGSQLLVVRLTIDSTQTIGNYFPLPGPAVYVVENGTLEIAGNGVAMIASGAGMDPILTRPGEHYPAQPGTTLLIPNDRLVVHIPDGTFPKITGSLIVTAAVDRAFLSEEQGGVVIADPARQIAQAVADQSSSMTPLSFGTLESLCAGVNLTAGGNLSFEAGWLLVPANSHLAIDRRSGGLVIALISSGDELTLMNNGSQRWVINNGERAELVLAAWIDPVP